ncbi:DUF1033 family protein [Streptococcus sp. zg-86]|uniref:DUF1033 family protein n=1 Tax=Streptococcus zhangguiae TaxID=2664091 RepID=A0A6I4RHB8_9STRE|nr:MULTISPECIES: DUF1033 family protein [unclassified Streptococcus]MTB63861.1 DUF1033 family protein [Streptococcus sp. zg-86]MTB90171.1 DUF1033 family protein [Streptococcus sp. zg-36]MWV55843.1 DUF1033 family protein [Streptococcus sp. zg-70]QTH48688.1 DUF1033 family protein [Streptococcus sp. zg-86]
MYRVIRMYGDFEPWWFLDGWEENIISTKEYDNYAEALQDYQRQWVCLSEQFPMRESRDSLMTAFWDPKDQYWCDECDESLQNYHSLILLEAKENLPTGLQRKDRGKRPRLCQMRSNKV